MKIKRHIVLQEMEDGTWNIREFKDGSLWPDTRKKNARETIARVMQIMDVGPVAPQTEPEKICLGELNE